MSKRNLLLMFFFASMGLLILLIKYPFPNFHPTQRTFRIQASQFAYSPSVIHVDPGDQVTLELVSMDVVHGLYLDGYGLSLQADPGQTSSLTFTADRSGSFRFRCSTTCGALHPFMIGKLQVGQNIWFLKAIVLIILAIAFSLMFPYFNKKTKAA